MLFYLGLLIALISWILIVINKGYNLAGIFAIPIARELFILLILSTISLLYASNLSYGIRYWSMVLQALLSYLMLYEVIDSKESILKFQQILLIPALLVASYGIFEYLLGFSEGRVVSFW